MGTSGLVMKAAAEKAGAEFDSSITMPDVTIPPIPTPTPKATKSAPAAPAAPAAAPAPKPKGGLLRGIFGR